VTRGLPTIAAVLGLLFFMASPCPAQGVKSVLQSLSGNAQPPPAEPSMAEQLDWARTRLSEAGSDEKALSDIEEKLKQADLPSSLIEDFRAAARETRRNYQNAVDLLNGLVTMEGTPATPVTSPATEEQASSMRDSLRRATLAATAAEGEIELFKRLISQQQALAANAEREGRQFGEEVATAKSEETKNRAAVRFELAGLQKRAADAATFFGKWKLFQQESLLRKAVAERTSLRRALENSGFDRQLNPQRAAKQLAAVAKETVALEKELGAATRDQQRSITEAASIKADPASGPRSAAAEALVTATQGLVAATQGALTLLELEKAHWLTVESLSKNLETRELQTSVKQSEDNLRMLKDWRPTMDRRIIEAREGMEAAQKQLRAGVADSPTREILERTVSAQQKRIEALGNLISRSESTITLQEEFLRELQSTLGGEGPSQRLARTWTRLSDLAEKVWSFELYPAGNSSITTGKIVLAAAGLALALLLSGWISRTATRTATKNFRIAEDQRTLLERSVFIPVAAIFILTVLSWLNIPLTVFAFLGGALAIGIGFGAQNLMNNFISGIILLLERQIKIGDIIEVAGSTGKVTHLGSRCSRIRKFDGVELLVPNSAFLEKEVTNWTLADPQHRYDFTVGAAYGSPVEKVMDLLHSAVDRQPEILRDPPAGVFFESFGDSSLVFRIYYWLELGAELDPRKVGSELRCRIERDLRAAGIEIPFPQRDLHIRNGEPLAVRLEK